VIQGEYLKTGSAFESYGFLFKLNNNTQLEVIDDFKSLEIRNKILLSPIRQIIVTYGKRRYGFPTISAYTWQNIFTIDRRTRVYYGRAHPNIKIVEFTVDKNKDILAFMKTNNKIHILKMATQDCVDEPPTLFVNSLASFTGIIGAHKLRFNNDGSELAILSNNRLLIYALKLPEEIILPFWAKCPTTATNVTYVIPTPTNSASKPTNISTIKPSNSNQILHFFIIIYFIMLLH
jgi:hypothetical protein